jgi:hypothetical protein
MDFTISPASPPSATASPPSSATMSCRWRPTPPPGTRTRTSRFPCSTPARPGAGRGALVPPAVARTRRAGRRQDRHGGLLRGDEPLDLRPGRLQLRRPRRRQHDGARGARHARPEGALARPIARGARALGLRHDRAASRRRLRPLDDPTTAPEKHGDVYVVHGRKWFITGAGRGRAFHPDRAHLGRSAATGLTAFLFHRDDPGWEILRRIPIMGPEEHGGHCEIVFDGLRIPRRTCSSARAGASRSPRPGSARRGSPIACAGSASPSAASRSRRTTRPGARASASG